MKLVEMTTPIMDFRLVPGAPVVPSMVKSQTCPNPECGRFRYRMIPGRYNATLWIDCLFCGIAFLVN